MTKSHLTLSPACCAHRLLSRSDIFTPLFREAYDEFMERERVRVLTLWLWRRHLHHSATVRHMSLPPPVLHTLPCAHHTATAGPMTAHPLTCMYLTYTRALSVCAGCNGDGGGPTGNMVRHTLWQHCLNSFKFLLNSLNSKVLPAALVHWFMVSCLAALDRALPSGVAQSLAELNHYAPLVSTTRSLSVLQGGQVPV